MAIRRFCPIESAVLRECVISNSPFRSTCRNTPDFIDRERMRSWTAYCSPGRHSTAGDSGRSKQKRRRRRDCARAGSFSPARGTAMELDRIVYRVREEFREMPGLRLTPAQATRLWGLEETTCAVVIERLVAAEYLRWTPAGAVTRAD